jgi:hypothetical protein
MTERGIRSSMIRAAGILLSLTLAAGCAHRPAQTSIRVPAPPRPNLEASDSQAAARRADRKVRDVIKQLEKNGRRAEKGSEADHPVSQVGTSLETSVSTTGTIPPPAGWSSVVSTPMSGATSGGRAAPGAPASPARSGNDQTTHRHIAAAIAFAVALALAIVLLPRWLSAR